MKPKRQKQEEALERTEQRVKDWERVVPERYNPANTFYSTTDHSHIAKASNKDLQKILITELAKRKIHDLTRDLTNLKKKLAY